VLFESWTSLSRTVLSTLLAYPALVLILRISGKRTLGKMNAFDLVVTVALGSTLSALVVSDVAVADGLLALILLVGFQYVIAWASVRSQSFEKIIKSEPSLLLYRGNFRKEVMNSQRIGDGEVLAAVRIAGLPDRASAGAVILESDGSLSVIPGDALAKGAELSDLPLPP
jgi:uncharacterized membrane protein YcaP (DUF421 family)